MASPPTFVAEYEGAFNSTTTPKSVTPTTSAGDVLVVCGISADLNTTLNTPTGNGLTYALATSGSAASHTRTYAWTTTDSTGGTGWTLQVTKAAGADFWGLDVARFSGSDGFGAATSATGSGTAPSMTLTTSFDNSAIVACCADWSAGAGARTWRTINGTTPTAANGFELVYFNDPSWYTVYVGYWPDAGAAGAKTVGLSAPTQTWTMSAVEVRGTTAAAAASLVFPRRPTRGLIMR